MPVGMATPSISAFLASELTAFHGAGCVLERWAYLATVSVGIGTWFA